MARAAESAAAKTGVEVIVAPPGPMVGLVARSVGIPVYSQTVAVEAGEKSTGAFLPEAVAGAGGKGTILNHSESPKPMTELRALMPRLRSLSMGTCLCSRTAREAVELASLGPDYLAVEPPELIGSGNAVSKERPELVSQTVTMVRRAGFDGGVLCGAGIVDGEDVKAAVGLGADGVLVASSVVRASDWEAKLVELARSLT